MNVGRAFVSIAPDTSRFRAQLVRELKPLVAAAERQVGQVKISATADTSGARRELVAFAQEMRRLGGAKVKVEADTGGVQEEVRREVAQAERKGPIRLKVELDKRAAGIGIGAIFGAVTARELTRLAFGATAIASAVQPAAAALAALGAAAYGAVAALSPLVGLLPALAVGASALGQGVGVAAAAFSGIGGALKAYKQSQDAATTSTVTGTNAARSAARAQQAASRQLRDAIADVDDARRASAEAVVAASERVEDAERDLTRSQEAARRAQEDLNEARRDAREELEDLQLAVERSALGEQRAHLRLEEARVRLRRVKVLDATSGGRASRQLRDATLDVAEAELSVREAAERRGDEQERLNKLTKNGIDGSERVIDAQDRIRAANEQVLDSRRALIAAEKAVTTAQEQGARRVSNALENVERAHESVADAAERAELASVKAAGGVDKFGQAMSKLSPAAQGFVRTLLSFEAPLKRLRDIAAENLFPGLTRGLNAMRPLFATFEPIVASTARTLGNLGERLGRLLGSPFFQRTFATLGAANVRIIESLGGALIALAPAIAQILIAAVPLAEAMARLAEKSSLAFQSFIDGKAASGGLARFFAATEQSVRLLWGVLRPLVEVLYGVGRAAKETGEFVLGGMGRSLDELADKVNSPEGQRGLREFFTSLHPALTEMGRLLIDLAREFANFAREGAPKLAPLIRQVREELLPALVELVNKAVDVGPKLIDMLTTVARFLAALPIAQIVGVFMGFLRVLTLIAESPIGGFLFQLASSLGVVRLAAFALKGTLALFGVAIGPWAIAIATAALLIIANWEKVGPVFEWIAKAVIKTVRDLVDGVLAAAEWIIKGMAKAFGWAGSFGDSLKKAAKAIEEFRDRTNASMNSLITEKTINVRFNASGGWGNTRRPDSLGERQWRHQGLDMGPIRGRPGQRDVPVLARTGEYIVTERQMAKLRSGNDGASAPVTNHTWNITAIPVGDLPTEIPRRIRDKQHLWT